jgi:REP element-mobilizing transposase RayT
MKHDDWAEVEALLSAEDEKRSPRRKPHHLPAEYYASTELIYCVTLCARHHGEPFAVPAVAEGVINALRFYRNKGLCAVYAYCLMPDHLHAVLRLLRAPLQPNIKRGTETEKPPKDLMKLVGNFKRYTTTQVAWKQGLHGKLWQRDFYDHIAWNREDFETQCRYTLDNPIRRGLVTVWSDYRWSGIMDEWL